MEVHGSWEKGSMAMYVLQGCKGSDSRDGKQAERRWASIQIHHKTKRQVKWLFLNNKQKVLPQRVLNLFCMLMGEAWWCIGMLSLAYSHWLRGQCEGRRNWPIRVSFWTWKWRSDAFYFFIVSLLLQYNSMHSFLIFIDFVLCWRFHLFFDIVSRSNNSLLIPLCVCCR